MINNQYTLVADDLIPGKIYHILWGHYLLAGPAMPGSLYQWLPSDTEFIALRLLRLKIQGSFLEVLTTGETPLLGWIEIHTRDTQFRNCGCKCEKR